MLKFEKAFIDRVAAEIKRIEEQAEKDKAEAEAKIKAESEEIFERGKGEVGRALDHIRGTLADIGLKISESADAHLKAFESELEAIQSKDSTAAEPTPPATPPAEPTPPATPPADPPSQPAGTQVAPPAGWDLGKSQ